MADKDFVVKNGITVNTNFSANSTHLYHSGRFVVNGTINTISISVTNGFSVNTNGNTSYLVVNNDITVRSNNQLTLTVGNNASINVGSAAAISIGNTANVNITSNLTINTAVITLNSNLVVNGSFTANGSVGTTGQILVSNASGIYWADFSGALNPNTSSSGTHYLTMANVSSGIWGSPYITPSKLYFVPSTGTLTATDFNSLSDERNKTNIQDISYALDTVTSLRGVSFQWKQNEKASYGVIAQEVEKIVPELVTTGENGIKTVNYDGFVAFLIESIKILNQKIEDLEKNK